MVYYLTPGGDLRSKIKEYKTARKFIDENIVLKYFVQICLGLKHAHDRKILHRDLKT